MKIRHFLKLVLDKKKDHLFVGIILLSSVILSLIEVAGVGGIMPFLDVIVDPALIQNDPKYIYVYNLFNIKSAEQFVTYIGLFLVALFLIKGLLTILVCYMRTWFGYKKQVDIANELLSSYLDSDYEFHVSTNSSVLNKNINVETVNIMLFMDKLLSLALDSIVSCFFLALLFLLSWKVTSILVIVGLLFYLVISKEVIGRTKRLGDKREKIQSGAFKFAQQAIINIKDIKIAGKEKFFANEFFQAVRPMIRIGAYFRTLTVSPKPVIETIVFSGAVVFCLTQLQGKDFNLGFIPSLGVYGIAIYKLMPAINRILSMLMDMAFFKVSIDIVGNQIRELRERRVQRKTRILKRNLESEILISDLSFRYDSSSSWLFEGVNLSIQKGERILIIGESGSGKSTFIDLLVGLLKPIGGKIMYDGVSLEDLDISKLVGYLPQKVTLLDASLRDNIAFGEEEEQIDLDRIGFTLDNVNLSYMNGSLDMALGEDGIKLSGGERQRIGIARIFYADNDIIILDEFSSALDRNNERNLIKEIMSTFRGRTIVAVSHRTGLASYFDTVYRKTNNSLVKSEI